MCVTRVFPESHLKDGSSNPHYVPLSILDSTVGRFAPTCATWIYDSSKERQVVSIEQLVFALQKTLDAYPSLGWPAAIRALQSKWRPYSAFRTSERLIRHQIRSWRRGNHRTPSRNHLIFCTYCNRA